MIYLSDGVPAVVDPVTTFKEEEFKHLEWDKDVAVVEDTYVEPEPPTVSIYHSELKMDMVLLLVSALVIVSCMIYSTYLAVFKNKDAYILSFIS